MPISREPMMGGRRAAALRRSRCRNRHRKNDCCPGDAARRIFDRASPRRLRVVPTITVAFVAARHRARLRIESLFPTAPAAHAEWPQAITSSIHDHRAGFRFARRKAISAIAPQNRPNLEADRGRHHRSAPPRSSPSQRQRLIRERSAFRANGAWYTAPRNGAARPRGQMVRTGPDQGCAGLSSDASRSCGASLSFPTYSIDRWARSKSFRVPGQPSAASARGDCIERQFPACEVAHWPCPDAPAHEFPANYRRGRAIWRASGRLSVVCAAVRPRPRSSAGSRASTTPRRLIRRARQHDHGRRVLPGADRRVRRVACMPWAMSSPRPPSAGHCGIGPADPAAAYHHTCRTLSTSSAATQLTQHRVRRRRPNTLGARRFVRFPRSDPTSTRPRE